jgi:hypothetical protein
MKNLSSCRKEIDMPWFRRAVQFTRNQPQLKNDFYFCIKIYCDARNIDYSNPELQNHTLSILHPQHLERISYRWLAEKGYHELKTLPD